MENLAILSGVMLIIQLAWLTSNGKRKHTKNMKAKFKGKRVYQPNQRMYLSVADMHSHRNAGL